MGRTIFVTVGTTLFDKLISATTSQTALEWMVQNGYTKLVLQYGKGSEPKIPTAASSKVLQIEQYRFRPTLDVDMQAADLILSHAGAGTVLEAMKFQKKLVVVINTELMDNHQTELAHAMGERHHLFVVESPELMANMTTWNQFENDFTPIHPQPQQASCSGGDNDKDPDFPRVVNALMGFSSTW